MFSRTKVELLEVPVGRGIEHVELSREGLTEYTKIAEGVGFRPAALLEADLRLFFFEHKIPLYDNREVIDFLTQKAKEQKKEWRWAPLRLQDVTKEYSIDDHHNVTRYWSGSWQSHVPYQQAVPASVLQTVGEIEKMFPKQVQFFVSDYQVPHPDPFIGVTAPHLPLFIFAHWDEPDWK